MEDSTPAGGASLPISTDVSRTARTGGSGPGVADPGVEPAEVARQRRVARQVPEVTQLGRVDPLAGGGRNPLGDRAPRDRDREPLTGLRAAEDLADVVAELLLRDHGHGGVTVAVLLPGRWHLGPPASGKMAQVEDVAAKGMAAD